MNHFNSSESLRNVDALVSKIDGLCKDIESALAFCLEVTSDKVADHGITLTQKMDTEYVDRVVLAMHNMKNHLTQVQKSLKHFHNAHDLKKLIAGLQDASDNLNQLLLSNNFFGNTFGLLVSEIQSTIDHILNVVPMHAMAD